MAAVMQCADTVVKARHGSLRMALYLALYLPLEYGSTYTY